MLLLFVWTVLIEHLILLRAVAVLTGWLGSPSHARIRTGMWRTCIESITRVGFFGQDWPHVMWPEEEDQSVQRLWEHDALGHQPPHRVGRVSFFSSKSKYSIEYCLGYCLTLLGFTKPFLKILSHVKSPLGHLWNKFKQYAPRSTVKHRMIEKRPTQILDFQSLGKGKKYSCLSNFCFDICVNDNDKFNCLKSVWFKEKKNNY